MFINVCVTDTGQEGEGESKTADNQGLMMDRESGAVETEQGHGFGLTQQGRCF